MGHRIVGVCMCVGGGGIGSLQLCLCAVARCAAVLHVWLKDVSLLAADRQQYVIDMMHR